MNQKKLKVLVAGCGMAGSAHVHDLLNDSRVGEVVVVDNDPQKLQALKTKLNVNGSCDFYREVQDPSIDAVVIASSNETHPPFAKAAFEAGKDVFCEKPLGITLADCREMVRSARKAGRILHCHFELRHSAIPSRIKAIIDSGEIGKLHSMSMVHYRGSFQPAWKGDKQISGGLALMETCHSIDLFRYISGSEFLELQSFAPTITIPYYNYSDTELLVMKMANGSLCHLTTSHLRSVNSHETNEWEKKKYGHQYDYTFLGSQGAIWYAGVRSEGICVYHHRGNGDDWRCHLARTEDFSHLSHGELIHWTDMPEFITAVQERRDTYITPEDALKTHEICFAAECSRERDGKAVCADEI